MAYKHYVKWPTLPALRAALEYDPSNKQQPLVCKTEFEGLAPGSRPGLRANGQWFVKIGAGSTFLRNLVWRVVEGSVPAGFSVDYARGEDHRIENLFLRNKTGEVRFPKTVPPELRINPPRIKPLAHVVAAAQVVIDRRNAAKRASHPSSTPATLEAQSNADSLPWD